MLLVGGQGQRTAHQGAKRNGGVEAAVRDASSAHWRNSQGAQATVPPLGVLDRIFASPRAPSPHVAFAAPDAARDKAAAKGGRAAAGPGADFIAAWLGDQRSAQRPARSAPPRGATNHSRRRGADETKHADAGALRVAVYDVTPRGTHHTVRVAAMKAKGGGLQPGVTRLAPHAHSPRGAANGRQGLPPTP